jgi:hypothetical protein
MRTTPSSKRLLLGGGGAGVDELGVVVDDALDETLLLEEGDGAAGERAVDLHAVDEGRLGDDAVGGDLLDDAVAAGGAKRSGVRDRAIEARGGGGVSGKESRKVREETRSAIILPLDSIETPTR